MATVGPIMLPLAHIFILGEKIPLHRFVGFTVDFAGVLIVGVH
jgi:drug/metabolite transporter (DMT)-like permease